MTAPSIESLRCVEYVHGASHPSNPDGFKGFTVKVAYEAEGFVVSVHAIGERSRPTIYRYSTFVALLLMWMPPTDADIAALQRLRLSYHNPVLFVDVATPEPE